MPRKLSAKQLDKQQDKLIEQAFYRVGSGAQIPVLDISKIFRAGRTALAAGEDLDAAIKAAVDTVKAN